MLLAAVSLAGALPAQAFDSCKVLLCLAGAWRSYPDCIPDVKEFLRCWSRGKCSLNCPMAGGASLSWASGLNCPPQYTYQDESGAVYCSKTGVIDVTWQGIDRWTRVWWVRDGYEDPVFEYSDAARAALGPYIDTKFDEDFAAWLTMRPPPVSSTDGGG
jgi:hypothetical protein